MTENIFIPERIKVGFNPRNDTYTGKLAYVIYFDSKGVLRKEKSWNSWINSGNNSTFYPKDENGDYLKDENGCHIAEIDPIKEAAKNDRPEFDNEPTEGFVLNKKVGGDRYGWNPRQTYCRVYDPRGFEFEITIPNLLYILENTNSIVGKGLEGKFVYGWQGKDLVLIPEKSLEYEKMVSFTSLQAKNISTKELKEGILYRTKQSDTLIYVGKFHEYDKDQCSKNKKFWFYSPSSKLFIIRSDIKFLAESVNDNIVSDFAFILDELEHHSKYSPVDFEKCIFEIIEDPKEFLADNRNRNWLHSTLYSFKDPNGRFINFPNIGLDYLCVGRLDEKIAEIFKLDLSPYQRIYNRYGNDSRDKRALTLLEFIESQEGMYKITKVLQNNKIQKY